MSLLKTNQSVLSCRSTCNYPNRINLILLFLVLSVLLKPSNSTNSNLNSLILNTKCFDIIKHNKDNQEHFNNEIISNINILKQESLCLELLITKGFLSQAEVLISELSKIGINFTNQLKTATSNAINKVKSVYNNYRFDESDFISVYPAFEWAQNLNYVFINIKYSHRWDAPGCVDVKKSNVEMFENLIMFNTYCIRGESPFKFILNLDLFGEINEKESLYNETSVGRFQLSLKKKNTAYWRYLLREGADSPANMKAWIEMREKYIGEIQEYIDRIEEDEHEQDYNKEIEVLKRKRNKKFDL